MLWIGRKARIALPRCFKVGSFLMALPVLASAKRSSCKP